MSGTLGEEVLVLRTDSGPLDAGLARAEAKSTVSSGRMQASMDRAGRATVDAALKLRGYELRVDAAQARVNVLSRALAAGTGDQQKLNDALTIAQGRLQLARGQMESYTAKTAEGTIATRALAGETRSLSAATGISSRAFTDLTARMGPVGRGLDDLTTRSRLYRKHGVDYLAAGFLGLEGVIVGVSARSAIHFEELGVTVQRETGLSGRALESLMATIRTVGRQSPYQLSEVSDAAVVLRKEFHQTDAQIARSADLMVAFAHATGQQVRPQMQQLARIMTDYRAPLSHVVGLTDELVAVSHATQQPISAITDSLDKVGPKLQAMGFGLNDSVRLLALFQASGIKADQMSRGLASALSTATAATSGGAAQLKSYQLAVDAAQLRVNKLAGANVTASTSQADLSSEMTIAQGKLDLAKQKYDTLQKTLEAVKGAHGDVATAIHGEIQQVVSANSKQDALNLAVGFFGKSLGPSMARAFYDNAGALNKVDKALKTTGGTQRLFGVDQKSLAGKTQEAKNAFQDLEIEIGTKVLPVLSDAVGWVDGAAHSIDKFYKHHQQLVDMGLAIGGIGSSLLLISRHSPLGSLLGGLAQKGGLSGLAGLLKGPSAGAGISGVRGPIGAGTLANPIATTGGGHGPGGAASAAGGAGADAAAADAAAAAARRTIGIAGVSVAGVSALASASKAQGDPLNQLNAMAHGADPTDVLHLIGLPSLSDLLPTVKKRIPLTPSQIALLGEGFSPDQLSTAAKVQRGFRGAKNTMPGGPILTAGGASPSQLASMEALKKLSLQANAAKFAIDHLGADSALTFANLATQATQAGNVKFHLADNLASELLRGKRIGSKGIQSIISEIEKLPPATQADTAKAMLSLTSQLEAKGAVATGTTHKLRLAITDEYEKMAAGVAVSAGKLASSIQAGSAQAARVGGKNMEDFSSSTFRAMNSGVISASKGAAMIAKALNATLKAFGQKPIPVTTLGTATLTAGLIGAGAGSASTVGPGRIGSGAAAGIAAGAARGALIQIGHPGEHGRDTVPMSVGGSNIVVGRGEQVAVFNADQQREMARTYRGGLPGFFAGRRWRPNYMAGGGGVPGFFPDPGTNYSVGEEPIIAKRLDALGKALGIHLEGLSGYRSPAHSVAVGGFADDPHTRGDASDTPGVEGVPEAVLERFRLTRPFGGAAEADHIQLLGSALGAIIGAAGSSGGAGVAAQMWKNLKAPRVRGTGTVPDLVRAALHKATAAANKYGRSHTAGAGDGNISGAGIHSGTWFQVATEIAKKHGWGPAEVQSWYGIEQIEDSPLSLTLKNPSSDAIGLAQGITGPGWYAAHGGSYGNIVGELTAMANYIDGTYGTPSAALAAERSRSPMWYAGGGLLPGFADGGWVRTGATWDTAGGYGISEAQFAARQGGGASNYQAGMSFAELLEAGANAGRRPDMTQLLGLPRGGYGMPYGTRVMFRRPGGRKVATGTKSDVGSGQPSAHFTTDLHQALASAIGWSPNQDIEIARMGANVAPAGKPGHAGPSSPHHRTAPFRFASGPASRALAGAIGHLPSPIKTGIKTIDTLMAAVGGSGALPDLIDYTGRQDDTVVQDWVNRTPGLDPSTGLVTPPDNSAPYIDHPFVQMRIAELHQLYAWQVQVKNKLARAAKLVGTASAPGRIVQLVARQLELRRKDEVKIKRQIRDNIRRMADLNKTLKSVRDQSSPVSPATLSKQRASLESQLRAERAKTEPYPSPKTDGELAANTSFKAAQKVRESHLEAAMTSLSTGALSKNETARSAQKKREISLESAIADLEADNKKLGGNTTSIGTRGQIGALGIPRFEKQLKALRSDRTSLIGPSGIGGLLGDARLALSSTGDIPSQLFALADPQLAATLAAAMSSSSTGTQDNSQLVSLLQQQLVTAQQSYAVSQAQYRDTSALANLPPFGGSFATGGIVPGPLGAPRTVIAHGGEQIGMSSNVRVKVEDHRTRVWVDEVEQTVRQVVNPAARRARRRLPGAGGRA